MLDVQPMSVAEFDRISAIMDWQDRQAIRAALVEREALIRKQIEDKQGLRNWDAVIASARQRPVTPSDGPDGHGEP